MNNLPGSATLHGGDASAVLVPALGGKVRDMMLGGRQWLWHNPQVPFALPRVGARYDESRDAGGFDECFPTVGQCRLPSWVEGAHRAKLPAHGELWAQPPDVADCHRRRRTLGDVHLEWRRAAIPLHAPHHRASRRMGGLRLLGDEHGRAPASVSLVVPPGVSAYAEDATLSS